LSVGVAGIVLAAYKRRKLSNGEAKETGYTPLEPISLLPQLEGLLQERGYVICWEVSFLSLAMK
jgi:hypothetical protein